MSAEVVSLASRDWRNRPQRTGGLWCTACEWKFIGVWPDERPVETMECPRCGAFWLVEIASEAAYKNHVGAIWRPSGKSMPRDWREETT